MNRAFGIVAGLCWLTLMVVLVQRDVVPFWSAQEAPTTMAPSSSFQVAIRNSAGTRVGTTWVISTPTEMITTIRSQTLIDLRTVSSLLPLNGPLMIVTTLTYHPADTLQDFKIRLDGAPIAVSLRGERCGVDFACTMTYGGVRQTVVLDGRLSQCLAETLRPFTHLRDLHVGQTWRIRLLDPLSLLHGQAPELKTQLVKVASRETIQHGGRDVPCFRIETDGAVAWANDEGRVLRQDVQIPLLGTWTLTDEPFDQETRHAAVQWIESLRATGLAAPATSEE